jgi:hypothetical protein
MLLLFHVIIALGSVGYTSYLYFSPSRRHFYTAYGLVGLTLASGTYLVLSTHQPLFKSCLAGLAYIGVVLFGIMLAHYRLAAETKIDRRRR